MTGRTELTEQQIVLEVLAEGVREGYLETSISDGQVSYTPVGDPDAVAAWSKKAFDKWR